MHKGRHWGLGLLVLGRERVVRRRRMPEYTTEPENNYQMAGYQKGIQYSKKALVSLLLPMLVMAVFNPSYWAVDMSFFISNVHG